MITVLDSTCQVCLQPPTKLTMWPNYYVCPPAEVEYTVMDDAICLEHGCLIYYCSYEILYDTRDWPEDATIESMGRSVHFPRGYKPHTYQPLIMFGS